MKALVYLAPVLPAAGIVVELLAGKMQQKPPAGTLYVPGILRIACHVMGVLFGAMAIRLEKGISPEGEILLAALFGLCVALIEIPAWLSRRYRVRVENDILYVTPYWGKARSVPLSRITRVWRTTRYDNLNLYTGKKLFCRVLGICVGYKQFRQMLEDRGLLRSWS
jgi:hypothetical protein